MQKSDQLKKWLGKTAGTYAVFIAVGGLLSLIPASRINLSEETFFSLRMFLVLFGPIYLTLIAKIILTLLSIKNGQTKDIAENSQGVLFAVTSLLMFVNLSNAETITDLTDSYIQNKGLQHLKTSKQYPLRGKNFLNVFLPVCAYCLILELMTLIICIVVFAPLSQAASNVFIFVIASTVLLLLLIPLILFLISSFQGNKAAHEAKRTQEKQAAIQAEYQVLETDPSRRKHYLKLPKTLTLLILPGIFLISGIVLYFTKNSQELLISQILRPPFLVLMTAALLLFIPMLMYWANCSGTSLVQRIYLSQGQLIYAGYSGSMEERVEYRYTLLELTHYHIGKRSIRIKGQFTKETKDSYGTRKKVSYLKTLWIPRTFPAEQEQALFHFLNNTTA